MGRLSIFFYFSENGNREFFDREFSGRRAPKFFVAYGLQTLRIESLKHIRQLLSILEEYG